MMNTKGKRRGTKYMFSRPFRKHGIVPLATNAPQVLPWQNWKSLQCSPACCWHCCKQTS
uniref:60S ribosomal protein L21 n=1 Tax=Cercocebus atys TaxID=9531 RepID=A0A2K5LT81_CERAT